MIRQYLTAVIFSLLFSTFGYSQSAELSDDSTVSILTCGTGDEMYSLFGHTAIRIKDRSTNLDVVYNYGAFDFSTPNFVLKFSKGDLQYFVTAERYDDFVIQYYMEKRTVDEQILNLTASQKRTLFNKLNEVMSSDERFYTYKFIDRNCTNMAVDIINEVLGSEVIVKTKVGDQTYRDVLFPYFSSHFYEQWGTSILFGTKVDQAATRLFLPIEFLQSLEITRHNGKMLSGPPKRILNFQTEKTPFSLWNNIYTYLILLVGVVVINRKTVSFIYLTLIASLGILFAVAGWFSLHGELSSNYNILGFNPIMLLVIAFAARKMHKATMIAAAIAILCQAVYFILLINKAHFWILMPLVATNVILLRRIMVKTRRSLPAVK